MVAKKGKDKVVRDLQQQDRLVEALKPLADQLGIPVGRRDQMREKVGKDWNSMEKFVHGSSTGAWKGATIDPLAGRQDFTDFGIGFYTFQMNDLGIDRASDWEKNSAG